MLEECYELVERPHVAPDARSLVVPERNIEGDALKVSIITDVLASMRCT